MLQRRLPAGLSARPCGSPLAERGADSAPVHWARARARHQAPVTCTPLSWVPGELQGGSWVPGELGVELIANSSDASLHPETGQTGTIVWKRGSVVLFQGCPRPTLLPGQLCQPPEGTQGS